MAYGLIAGALVLFGSSAFMHFTYSKSSNKKERYFLCAVVLNLLVQMFIRA